MVPTNILQVFLLLFVCLLFVCLFVVCLLVSVTDVHGLVVLLNSFQKLNLDGTDRF